MPESFRCKCFNDEWTIFTGKIKCNKCGKEYKFDYVGGSISYNLPTAKIFNSTKEK